MTPGLPARSPLTLRRLASALLLALVACEASTTPAAPATALAGAGASSAGAGPSGSAGGTGGAPAALDTAGAGAGTLAPSLAGAGASGVAASGSGGSAGSAGSGGALAMAGADASVPEPACDRACLTELNTAYLEALVARDATGLPLAASVRFTENGAELALDQGLWAVAQSLREFRQDFAEVSAGQTAGFAALDDDAGAVLLAFRLKVVAREITEIETIVARQGEATFFSPTSLRMRDPLYDMDVPPAERSSRDALIAVVETYFEGIETGDGSAIPVDASAARNENGTVTARGSSIQNLAMFSYIESVTRRYVLVDEERGNVLPFVLFEIPNGLGGSRTLHLAELFKVQDGQIMDILAIMVNQPLGTPSGWE